MIGVEMQGEVKLKILYPFKSQRRPSQSRDGKLTQVTIDDDDRFLILSFV